MAAFVDETSSKQVVVGAVVVSEASLIGCLKFVEKWLQSVVEKTCKELVKKRDD